MMWKIGSGSGHTFIGWLDGFDTTNRSIVQQESRVINDENSCLSWVMPSNFNPALPPEKQCQFTTTTPQTSATNIPLFLEMIRSTYCVRKRKCVWLFSTCMNIEPDCGLPSFHLFCLALLRHDKLLLLIPSCLFHTVGPELVWTSHETKLCILWLFLVWLFDATTL